MNYCDGKCNGFTLAEVLITLVIIGVIAAITVPTLIVKYQKEQTVIRLKKAYSTIAQTTQKAIADNGPITTWEVNNATFADKYLVPYLNVARNCRFDRTTSGCNPKHAPLNDQSNLQDYSNSNYIFYLSDGTIVIVNAVNESGGRKYANISFDINGMKKPNVSGKDIFSFRYEIYWANSPTQTGKFFPTDFSFDRNSALNYPNWGCNKNASGTYCATVIMKDGWQIKDDYPW